jgi:hypothetical protein
LNDNASLHGTLLAPSSTVTLNGSATLRGLVECDRLILNRNATVENHEPLIRSPERGAHPQWKFASHPPELIADNKGIGPRQRIERSIAGDYRVERNSFRTSTVRASWSW